MMYEIEDPKVDLSGTIVLTFKLIPGPMHDEVTIESVDKGRVKRNVVKYGQLVIHTTHLKHV